MPEASRSCDVEGEVEYGGHDEYEAGDGRILAGEDAVDAFTAGPLLALFWADDRGLADLLDEVEAHVGHGGAAIHAALGLHLDDDVLQHVPLVVIEIQLVQDQMVPLHRLAGGEAHREARPLGVVLDEVDDAV